MYSSPPLAGARIVQEVRLARLARSAPRAVRLTLQQLPRASYCLGCLAPRQVLGDAALCAQWRSECAIMANRIIDMRIALKEALVKVATLPRRAVPPGPAPPPDASARRPHILRTRSPLRPAWAGMGRRPHAPLCTFRWDRPRIGITSRIRLACFALAA
eukprot:scaffold12489_cov27-Tisochrysis_lutea.AAC.2